jgi:CDP-diacylglycerol--serine O-phosphatidyltransferase
VNESVDLAAGGEPSPGRGRRRRRRRGPGARRRGLSLLPHLFTTGNLAAGFYAAVKATSGDLDGAALAIIVAMVFDVLDGRVARIARATSRFGAEYDSIADTVSFGVAPGLLAFHGGTLHELGWTGWVLAFIYVACAGLRLARFNVSPGRYPGRFEGLPSPAAAGLVAATVWLAGFLAEGGLALDPPPALVGLGAALLGLLMVSPIPYRSFKNLELRGSYRATVLMVIGFAVLLSKPSVTFFLMGVAYAASGPVEWWWRRRTGRLLEPLPGADLAGREERRGTNP